MTIVPGGFLVTDLHGVIQDVDHAAAVFMQTAGARLVGKPLSALFHLEPGMDWTVELQRALVSHQMQDYRASFVGRSGDPVPVRLSVGGVFDTQGQLQALRWLIRQDLDASDTVSQRNSLLANQELQAELEKDNLHVREELERRVAERTAELAAANQRLQIELAERQRSDAQRTRELSALNAATIALLSTLDLEKLLGQILDAATSAIPAAEKGTLHLIARDTGQLEMRAAIGYSDPRIQKVSFPGSKGYVARAVRGRSPLLIRDASTDPTIRYNGKIPEVRAIQSVIVAPLIESEQVLGAISLESAQRAAFNEDDLHLLVGFAATATTAIHNAQLHAEVQKMAITDTLTGLYNRRGFDELGKRELERMRRFGNALSALMIDVDRFKDINDTYGHHVGDQAVRAVAHRMSANLREVDIVGRFGGDEFTILLPETDLITAGSVAERLRGCVADTPLMVENIPIRLTISVGVAKAAPDMLTLDALIGRADKALYQAKQSGRNRVEVFGSGA